LINNEVLVDGELKMISDLLKDEVLHKIFSNEAEPMVQPGY
jgi:hypothetical protein